MKTIGSLVVLMTVGVASIAGCSTSTNESSGAGDEQDVTSFTSPEALAHWLGTNDAMSHLGQFVDPRADKPTPIVDYAGECCVIGTLSHANVDYSAFQDIIDRGRIASSEKLPIVVSSPETKSADGFSCISRFAVYVRAGKASWLGPYATPDNGLVGSPTDDDPLSVTNPDAARAFAQAIGAAQASTTVEVDFYPADQSNHFGPPAGDLDAPRTLHLAFGVVNRPLTNAPNAPVGQYWTILAASVDDGRCDFGSK